MSKPHRKNFGQREPKEFEEEVLQIDRVTRVVAGGRRMRFRATVVIGNKRKKVGLGTGKANEVTVAIQKAISKARKNLLIIPIENDTIPHEVEIKFKAAKMLLMPAGPGTGIIAGGPLRKILELAGVKNILSKCFGTNNKLANAQAAMLALGKLTARQPAQQASHQGEKTIKPKTPEKVQKEDEPKEPKDSKEVKDPKEETEKTAT